MFVVSSFVLHQSPPTYIYTLSLHDALPISNAVYHPSDYALLSAHMEESRMGRAFGVHTFAGYLGGAVAPAITAALVTTDRKSTRLNSSHTVISYAVFCLKKKTQQRA